MNDRHLSSGTNATSPVWQGELLPALQFHNRTEEWTRLNGAAVPRVAESVLRELTQRDDQAVRLVNMSSRDLEKARDATMYPFRRGQHGRIQEQARLERGRPTIQPGPMLMLTIASAVSGTLWQQQIDRQLKQVQTGLSHVQQMLDSDRRSRMLAAQDRLRLILASDNPITMEKWEHSDLTEARIALKAELDDLKNVLQRAPEPHPTTGKFEEESYVAWCEGGDGTPGLLKHHQRMLEAYIVDGGIQRVREAVYRAAGDVSGADQMARELLERSQEVRHCNNQVDMLVNSDREIYRRWQNRAELVRVLGRKGKERVVEVVARGPLRKGQIRETTGEEKNRTGSLGDAVWERLPHRLATLTRSTAHEEALDRDADLKDLRRLVRYTDTAVAELTEKIDEVLVLPGGEIYIRNTSLETQD